MASEWRYRSLAAGPLVLTVLYWTILQWSCVVAQPYFYPSAYYYSPGQVVSPTGGGYSYYQQPSAAQSQNVAVYSGKPNYYGVPDYDDRRSVGSRWNDWNDPYLQWKWNNYYNRYYYPRASSNGGAGWNDRHDHVHYYNSKRRQDSPQPVESAPEPATTRRPRKKKLFVPNVWG